MLLKQLQYFVAVVEEDSFTAAAEREYISQSAISQAIASLEKELDTKLLNRRNRSFSLTPAGQFFYQRSRYILDELERMRTETMHLGRVESGRLDIGYLSMYIGPELFEAVAEFADSYPEVQISTVSGTHEELYNGLVSGEINLALSDQRRAFSPEYENVELKECALMIEISKRQESADASRIEISQLPDMPCILVAPREHQLGEEEYYRDILGVGGKFVFAQSIEEARLMAVSKRGFLPVESIGRMPQPMGNLQRLSLYRDGRKLQRKYCLFWKKSRSNFFVEEFARIFEDKFIARKRKK